MLFRCFLGVYPILWLLVLRLYHHRLTEQQQNYCFQHDEHRVNYIKAVLAKVLFTLYIEIENRLKCGKAAEIVNSLESFKLTDYEEF